MHCFWPGGKVGDGRDIDFELLECSGPKRVCKGALRARRASDKHSHSELYQDYRQTCEIATARNVPLDASLLKNKPISDSREKWRNAKKVDAYNTPCLRLAYRIASFLVLYVPWSLGTFSSPSLG